MRTTILALLVTAALAPAAAARPAHADHSIRFFESIGGVALGDTPAQVRAHLGAPPKLQRYPGQPTVDWIYDHLALTVEFHRGRVDYVSVEDPAFHGPRGVRPGAPWSKAKEVYDGLPCGTLTFQCTFSFTPHGVTIQHGKVLFDLGFMRRHGERRISTIALLRNA